MTAAGTPRPLPFDSRLRWIAPAVLLAIEWVVLSILVELPTTGPAKLVGDALRLALPVVLGAGGAAWFAARTNEPSAAPASDAAALPPWRPLPWVVAQLLAFAGTAALAVRFMAAGGPSGGLGPILLVLGCAAATSLLALFIVGPPAAIGRFMLRRWRAPLGALFLGAGAWWAATSVERLWGTLSSATLHAVAAVLGAVVGPPVLDVAESLIGLGDFQVLIKPECSGADGIGLVVIFELIWIAMARARLRVSRALLLVPLGVAAALLANVLRIAGLIMLGAAGHEQLALGGFHSKVGWALFLGIALGSVALAERVAWLRKPAAPVAGAAAGDLPEVATLAPFVFALAAALLTGIWTAGTLDRAYALRLVAAVAALAVVRRSLPSLRPSRSLLPALVGLALGALWVASARGDPEALWGELAALGAGERTIWIAVRGLGSVLVIPLVEELAFRGFLFGWLVGPEAPDGERRSFPWLAVLVSALAFGAVHMSFTLGVLAGLGFGVVRAWRDRLGDAVVAHACANAAVAVAAVVFSRWDLWT